MAVTDLSLKKRIALELHRAQVSMLTREHTLNYLMWECTLRCNLSCRHCGSDCRRDSSQKDMPLGDFLSVVDSIAPHVDTEKTMIVLTGGEPLMRADLEKCGMELHRRRFPWGMVTNGLALTARRLDGLIRSGLRSVTVSLDGLEESHNRMREHRASFAAAFSAVKMLVQRSDDIVFDVVTCVTKDTFGELDALKELLIGAGVGRWRLFTVFPIGRAADDDALQLSPRQFRDFFEFIRRTRAEGGIAVSYGCEGFLGSYEGDVRDGFFICRAGIGVGSVLVDGSISACPNLRSNFIQGNIYRDDFMDVWNNRYEQFRDRRWAKTGECARCRFFRYCRGNGMHLRDDDGNLLFCHLHRIKEGERPESR